MHKYLIALAAAGTLALLAPAASADMPTNKSDAVQLNITQDHAARIREEIRLQEGRAHELEPIIARDRQAHDDLGRDAAVLERHARELHAKANDFRQYAALVSGRSQDEMNHFATELDTYAQHDEQNAATQHQMASQLEGLIRSEEDARQWHLAVAQRLRDWLGRAGF